MGDPNQDTGEIMDIVIDSGGGIYAASENVDVGIYRWDGAKWSPLADTVAGSMAAILYDLAIDPWSGTLVAGGHIRNAGAEIAQGVARWNGGHWSALGSGVDGNVQSVVADGRGNIYLGGDFKHAGGALVNGVTKAALPVSTTPAGGTLNDAVDFSSSTWTTGGQTTWFRQATISKDHSDAAQSGRLLDGQQSWMETTVQGAGRIQFWSKGEMGSADRFTFFVDHERSMWWSGSQPFWTLRQIVVHDPGTHRLRWHVSAGENNSPAGTRAVFIDSVSWSP
jgi:hypothetical protein